LIADRRATGRFDEYGLIGLVTVDTQYNITDPASYNRANMSGQGLDRKVEGDKVTYSYALKEYRGLDEYPSADTVIQSTSSCIGRPFTGAIFTKRERKWAACVRNLALMPSTPWFWSLRADLGDVSSS
jgi:hypothetical protein